MLLIYITLIAMLAMAKHPKSRKRRMGRYIRGNVNEVLALGTLGPVTVISAAFDNVVSERTLVSSVVATYAIENFTPNAGDGPIAVGLAHSDYSDAEIQAVMTATASWAEGDLVAQEIAKRKVRRVGVFDPNESGDVLNDGKAIKTKLNWILNSGQTLRVWAFNTGASTLATTDPDVTVEGHANLWPR